jgi:hypothetical protein
MPGEGVLSGDTEGVSALKIGYARVSANEQDLTAQRTDLEAFGVPADRI